MGNCIAQEQPRKSGEIKEPLELKCILVKNGGMELRQNYSITSTSKILGAGQFGKVFLSHNIADPSLQVAIKMFNKTKLTPDQTLRIKDEVKILTTLDHPNIVKYYQTFEDAKYMYLVMEYCPGGELFDKIASQENQVFNESEAANIMMKLLRAINHCHAWGVTHRDIKPENIMYGAEGDIKLIDFGLSKVLEEIESAKNSRSLSTVAGTLAYMAPEVITEKYDPKHCDIWSLGVLMYLMVSGYLPFQGENRNQIYKKIQSGSFHFNHKEFDKVSNEGKELIKRMLIVDSKRRITADQALKDPWFSLFQRKVRIGSEEDKLDPAILERLRQYRGVSTLKKAAMNLLVKMADNKDIQQLREIFIQIDKDHTGDITAIELKEALYQAQIKISDDELEKIVSEVDYHGDKMINYSEFLSATIHVKNILTEEKLLAIFRQFDIDASGKITAQNIVSAMEKLGNKVNEEELKEIFTHYDIDQTGDITFDEFKLVFENIQ